MSNRKVIKVGDEFGKLTVVREPFMAERGSTCLFDVECKCTCGNIKIVPYRLLEKGIITACPVCGMSLEERKAQEVKCGDRYGELMVNKRQYHGSLENSDLRVMYECRDKNNAKTVRSRAQLFNMKGTY